MSILLSKVANPARGEIMKTVLAFAVAALVGVSTVSVFAGEGCCAAAKAKSASGSSCSDVFSKMNLTDAQKAQIDALKEQTKRATSTSESRAMFTAGLEKILTPDQLSQCKAQCDKARAGSECPYMKSPSKS
jgi:hypothetical protein